MNDSILIVDDNDEYRDTLCLQLMRRGYQARAARSGTEALARVRESAPGVVILDMRLDDMSGLDVLAEVRRLTPAPEVIIATAYPEVSSAVGAMRQKAVDYLCKPFSFDELETVLRRVGTRREGEAAVPALPAAEGPAPVRMVGDSAATTETRALIEQIATTGVRAALITGESGTGKDLAARLFHASSRRAHGPFIELNSSAITETLFESELFGHEKGAFTGAVRARRGLVELADGGTLFLDEVGDLPLPCQAKLLRFLEDQTFMRVGSERKMQVDVQIIAATNRDLRTMVEQWAFRADLYFRLNVVPIVMPPLRSRREDVAPLLRHWLDESNARYGKSVQGFAPEAEAALRAYPWPGNVRELRNLVERLVVLARGSRIQAADLPAEYLVVAPPPPPPPSREAEVAAAGDSLEDFERAHIRKVLARVDGNKTRAAAILGISRATLRIKLDAAVRTA
ncbi:MAG TPA: sigma-54 dependent transcriptional regulator [Terriglobales bacterium]|nr:sigma-54 dependent transcriptional regulator [Terriglobales bacterium]